MGKVKKMSKRFRKYQHIVDEFKKIKGVERVDIVRDAGSLTLIASNGLAGKSHIGFTFKLEQMIVLDVVASPTDEYHFKILELEDHMLFVEIGIKKAEMFFKAA